MKGNSLKKLERFFLFFSSEDIYFIERFINDKKGTPESRIKYYFLVIGIAVLIFFICSTVSITFFILNILEGYLRILSIPIGVFIGLLLSNIYLFLLYTITPTLFNTVDKKKRKNTKLKDVKNTYQNTSIFSFSFLFRAIFIVFIALIIAQPLNVALFINMNIFHLGDKEITQIEYYKTESLIKSYLTVDSQYTESEKKIFNTLAIYNNYLNNQDANLYNEIKGKTIYDEITINKLNTFKNELQDLNSNFIKRKVYSLKTHHKLIEVNSFIEEITLNDQNFLAFLQENTNIKNIFFKNYIDNSIPLFIDKIKNHLDLKNILEKNNLYTLKIKYLLGNNFFAFILTVLVAITFCLPVFAKFLIRKKFNYYKFRGSFENSIINDIYIQHCQTYNQTLYDKVSESYNQVIHRLGNQLELIRPLNFKRYLELKNQITNDSVVPTIEKYQYWADPPFRTERKSEIFRNSQKDLIDKMYNQK